MVVTLSTQKAQTRRLPKRPPPPGRRLGRSGRGPPDCDEVWFTSSASLKLAQPPRVVFARRRPVTPARMFSQVCLRHRQSITQGRQRARVQDGLTERVDGGGWLYSSGISSGSISPGISGRTAP